MNEKLTGHINAVSLNGNIAEKNIKGKANPFMAVGYDDTEIRKIIENNLNESKQYTDNKIAGFVEEDPTMLAISNLEIEEILDKWEE